VCPSNDRRKHHQSPEYAAAKAGVIRFTVCLAPLRDAIGVRASCICPDLVDTPASRRSRARMTATERAALPPVLTSAAMKCMTCCGICAILRD